MPEKPFMDFDWRCKECDITIIPFYDYEKEQRNDTPDSCNECGGSNFEIANRVVC